MKILKYKFYKIQINRDDSEAIIYHPTPLVKWFFLAALIMLASNCWNNIYFRKLLKFAPPPSKKCRVVALQNYGALQLLELHEVPTSTRCLLPVRLLDLYVSSVVWVCTYDPSSLFQKSKTVTVMWCDYTLAAVHLILFAGIVALWIRITRVIAFALIRICCLGGCIYILVLHKCLESQSPILSTRWDILRKIRCKEV